MVTGNYLSAFLIPEQALPDLFIERCEIDPRVDAVKADCIFKERPYEM